MIIAHRAAVQALLVGLPLFLSRADSGAEEPYIVLHPTQGDADTTSFGSRSDWRTWEYQTTCVGLTAEQAQLAAEWVEGRLLDAVPTVTGRRSSPVRKVATVTVMRDEDVQPPVFTARDVWAFSTIPA